MKKSRPLKWATAAFVASMALFGSGIALASVPDGNSIHTCRKTSTGALRAIDTNQTCTSSETALNWSQWNFRGAYTATKSYKKGDITTSAGSSFVATADIPVNGPDNWAVIAQAGKTGAKGATGAKGTSTVYATHCDDCSSDTAHDSGKWFNLLSLNLPDGYYSITAHAGVMNRQVFESEHVSCAVTGGTPQMVSLDAAGVSGSKTHADIAVGATGHFNGKVYLGCYGDDSWHAWPSDMEAISVDKVVSTTTP